jgi:hypothetical protein
MASDKGWINCRFGSKEYQLFYVLHAVSLKKTTEAREKETWWLVQAVFGPQNGRSKRRFLSRLRQLQRAVNKKLARNGDQRRIRSSRPGYRHLWDPVHPPLPRRSAWKQTKPSRKKAKQPTSRKYPSVGTCVNLLRDCLEKGIHHSVELERCCRQIGCSWRCYRAARDRLELCVVHRLVDGRWRWELYLPERPQTASEHSNLTQQ